MSSTWTTTLTIWQPCLFSPLYSLYQLRCYAVTSRHSFDNAPCGLHKRPQIWSAKPVFLNRWAAARYRALESIIPGRERFSWNLSF